MRRPVEADRINSANGREIMPHVYDSPPPEVELIDVLEAATTGASQAIQVLVDELSTTTRAPQRNDTAAMVASQAKGNGLQPEDYLL